MLSADDKRRLCALAPIGSHILPADARVIERAGRMPWPGWYQIISPTRPYARANEIVHGDIDAVDPERVIDEIFATYRGLGLPFMWCVYPWTRPHDLSERLMRRGATTRNVRGMVCDTALSLGTPEGASVERVSPASLQLYLDTMARGWDTPPDEARFYHEGLTRRIAADTSEMFLARWHGEPAATAGTVLKDGHGYLIGGNVLPEHRGRGIYRSLLDVRLTSLRQRGIELAVTHARDATSAPMLEHLGFETVFPYTIYEMA